MSIDCNQLTTVEIEPTQRIDLARCRYGFGQQNDIQFFMFYFCFSVFNSWEIFARAVTGLLRLAKSAIVEQSRSVTNLIRAVIPSRAN